MPKPYKKKRNYYRRDPYYYAYVFAPTGARAWAERSVFGATRERAKAKKLQSLTEDWESLSWREKARVYEELDKIVSTSFLRSLKKSPEPSS